MRVRILTLLTVLLTLLAVEISAAATTPFPGILYVYPDGTKDSGGVRFWNGTPECCDFEYPKVNDDAYIMSIIDKVSAEYALSHQSS